MSTEEAPFPRLSHTAVWTGESMIVWGGVNNGYYLPLLFDDGGLYHVKPPNRPPVADGGPDLRIECSSQMGSPVRLDGTGSTDPDSTPGTNDDIVQFTWIEDFGSPAARVLGESAKLQITLPLGEHHITLQVTDHAGATATDEVVVAIVDTRPPSLTLALTPELLWPPNSRMVTITATVTATDACSATTFTLDSITKNESARQFGSFGGGDDVQGADYGTADLSFMLRASRNPHGIGRVYTVVYTAVDASGNATTAEASVIVPHDMRDKVKGLEPIP
jgi:hypothetical protein